VALRVVTYSTVLDSVSTILEVFNTVSRILSLQTPSPYRSKLFFSNDTKKVLSISKTFLELKEGLIEVLFSLK
jgi:hypothetical protein